MSRAWVLCVVLALSLGVLGPADAQHHRRRHGKRPTKKVGQLRQDLAAIQRKKAKLKKELRTTKHKANVVVADIGRVDAKLENIQGQLEDTTDRLSTSQSQQRSLTKELAAATVQLAKTRVQVGERIRHMYMEGKGSFVSVLIGSKSVGDIASKKYLLEAIANEDRRLFDSYTQLRASVSDKKNRQDQLVTQIRVLARNQRAQESELEDAKQEKKDALGTLRAKQGELQELLGQFEQDERSIESQIRAYNARPPRPGPGGKLPRFTGRLARPLNARITSGFGRRFHPILHIWRLHAGVDFGAAVGTSIHAAGDGIVIAAQYMRGYGNVVMVDHGGGISTVYGHCSRIRVRAGQTVRRGQPIANVGSTGLSTGPHLHFEVRVNGRAVNPLGYLGG